MYKNIIRPLLFSLDSESAHHVVISSGKFARKLGLLGLVRKIYEFEDSKLEQNLFGLRFKNPVGLAAGSDKNCEAQEFLSALGFGFLESVGFVYEPQEGNPRPRVFRLPKDEALINRMGFPTVGGEEIARRVAAAAPALEKDGTVFGINFGKSKSVPNENAAEDYLKSFNLIKNHINFVVINVSSPNTPGLRDLQQRESLNQILKTIQAENTKRIPVLVKVAPDLSLPELDDILECAELNNLSGVVATNTTRSRGGLLTQINEEGGLSGRPLFPKAIEFVKYIRRRFNGKLKIIGVGGIFRGEDAIQMMKAGADLIELYAGLVYEGPMVACKIKKHMSEYLLKHSISNIAELVGLDNQY